MVSLGACAHKTTRNVTVRNATCSQTGLKRKVCRSCSKVVSTQTIAKKFHKYGSWATTKSATCTTKGERSKNCIMCTLGASEQIPATGHKLGTYTYDSTVHYKVCSVCKAKVNVGAHTFSNNKCGVCGYNTK